MDSMTVALRGREWSQGRTMSLGAALRSAFGSSPGRPSLLALAKAPPSCLLTSGASDQKEHHRRVEVSDCSPFHDGRVDSGRQTRTGSQIVRWPDGGWAQDVRGK